MSSREVIKAGLGKPPRDQGREKDNSWGGDTLEV